MGGPYNMDYSILESILGSLYFECEINNCCHVMYAVFGLGSQNPAHLRVHI